MILLHYVIQATAKNHVQMKAMDDTSLLQIKNGKRRME